MISTFSPENLEIGPVFNRNPLNRINRVSLRHYSNDPETKGFRQHFTDKNSQQRSSMQLSKPRSRISLRRRNEKVPRGLIQMTRNSALRLNPNRCIFFSAVIVKIQDHPLRGSPSQEHGLVNKNVLQFLRHTDFNLYSSIIKNDSYPLNHQIISAFQEVAPSKHPRNAREISLHRITQSPHSALK